MKKTGALLCIIIFMTMIIGCNQGGNNDMDKQMNILFIGNSFTFFNEMPGMVKEMGLSNNWDITVEQIAYGGYSLSDYIEDGSDSKEEVINKLNELTWDYVVLQDSSRKPLDNEDDFLLSISILNDLITDKGAQTVLFSTWSYREESLQLQNTGLTYIEFYNVLTNAYNLASSENDTLIAPVGTAFYNLTTEHPEIELLMLDNIHPTMEGSYVAAYIFYTLIISKEDNNEYKPTGISDEILVILREFAIEVLE
ncbi:MAG: hypothetical protein KAI72_10810 [Candidatus Pacebacteria bacterium]|nr:hypothetical protein [Candidatus Paceibacterota bacterium]